MKTNSMRPVGLVLALTAAAAIAGCHDSVPIASTWRDREVVVDGDPTDWEGLTQYLEEKQLHVGVMNDSDRVYVCIVLGDETQQRQLLHGNWTVWFDPAGGETKTLGVRYPLSSLRTPPRGMPGESGGERNLPSVADEVAAIKPEYEIVGPDGEAVRQNAVGSGAVDVAAAYRNGALVYELEIPFAEIGQEETGATIHPGQVIGVGVETGQRGSGRGKKPMGPGGMGGPGGGMGPPGGGMGPPGGGMGGPGGGMGPPGGGMKRPDMPEPLKVWAKVTLGTQAAPP